MTIGLLLHALHCTVCTPHAVHSELVMLRSEGSARFTLHCILGKWNTCNLHIALCTLHIAYFELSTGGENGPFQGPSAVPTTTVYLVHKNQSAVLFATVAIPKCFLCSVQSAHSVQSALCECVERTLQCANCTDCSVQSAHCGVRRVYSAVCKVCCVWSAKC